MADYICYIDDNTVITVDEFKELFIDTKIEKPIIRCLCNSRMFYRSNSIDIDGNIKKIHHFAHVKGAKCNLNQIFILSLHEYKSIAQYFSSTNV